MGEDSWERLEGEGLSLDLQFNVVIRNMIKMSR